MRISEMRKREPFDRILVETLTRGWSEQFNRHTEVKPFCDTDEGQHWSYHPLLSAFVVPEVNRTVRQFLKNSFRYTPVRHRVIPQWVLGTVLGSRIGLQLARQPGFTLSEPFADAASMAVVPGNQRVRIF